MRTLVAGFGNILLGDDGFGVEVIRRLDREGLLPDDAELIDVGIGGYDFVLRLMDGYDRVVVVDAVRLREKPGTLHVFRPVATDVVLESGERLDPHFAEPARAMIMARQMSCLPADVTVVGCEPLSCELGVGLSDPVEAAVRGAMATVKSLAELPAHAI